MNNKNLRDEWLKQLHRDAEEMIRYTDIGPCERVFLTEEQHKRFEKDIKCYYINFEYYWNYEVDDDEDVKQIDAAVIQREVDKIVNWETRKYESSSGT